MQPIHFLVLCGLAALIPGVAHANTGVGLLVLAVPVTIVALLPVILVEAPILSRVLELPGRRALWMSLVANVVSTIAGAAIAVASSVVPLMWGEFVRMTVLISLVAMFFVTWWIENLVVRRMLPEEGKSRSRRATGLANVASYLLMAIGVLIFVSSESATFDRWRLTPALDELGVAKADVAEHFQSRGAFPAPRSLRATDKTVKSIALEGNGRLVATLSFPGRPDGDGKHIVYEPVVIAGKITEWKCTSDVHAKYLPAQCR